MARPAWLMPKANVMDEDRPIGIRQVHIFRASKAGFSNQINCSGEHGEAKPNSLG
jgi:hypothetical protein